MAETVPSINLLPQKGDSFLTQFFNWTLSIGRLLIILTEFVALGTFLYRFGLDMQIVDLHDKIKSHAILISNFKSAEDNYRNLHERLALIKQYDSIGNRTSTLFNEIATLGKGKVTFKNLTVEAETAKIEAQALSSNALSQFISSLNNHPLITSVSVDKVENATSKGVVNVTMTAKLESAAFEKTPEIEANAVPVFEE